MTRSTKWIIIVGLLIVVGFNLVCVHYATAAIHEQVTCTKGTDVSDPFDDDPYHTAPASSKASTVTAELYVTCYSHYADSVQMVMVNDLSLHRGKGAKRKRLCSTNTAGYKIMEKTPRPQGAPMGDFFATYELWIDCPAGRVDRTFPWTTMANITLRTTFRSAKPAYSSYQLKSNTVELHLR